MTLLSNLVPHFEVLETELNDLDAATGDGDHGTTILKGLRAAAEQPDAAVKAFRTSSGGASGSIFSVVLGALLKAVDGADLQVALQAAADRISEIGQAQAGDKTMLDALLPAAQSASGATAALNAAEEGFRATKVMAAKRGRARYVEHAGVGHLDAGAKSVVEMLRIYAATRDEK